MKNLSNYVSETLKGTLNLRPSISYPIFADIYLYLDNNTMFLDRAQAICDTYRKKYNENLSADILVNSKIFEKFIDDLIKDYKENVRTVEINFGTKKHLMEEIASKLLTKVKTENDLPQIYEED